MKKLNYSMYILRLTEVVSQIQTDFGSMCLSPLDAWLIHSYPYSFALL